MVCFVSRFSFWFVSNKRKCRCILLREELCSWRRRCILNLSWKRLNTSLCIQLPQHGLSVSSFEGVTVLQKVCLEERLWRRNQSFRLFYASSYGQEKSARVSLGGSLIPNWRILIISSLLAFSPLILTAILASLLLFLHTLCIPQREDFGSSALLRLLAFLWLQCCICEDSASFYCHFALPLQLNWSCSSSFLQLIISFTEIYFLSLVFSAILRLLSIQSRSSSSRSWASRQSSRETTTNWRIIIHVKESRLSCNPCVFFLSPFMLLLQH